MKKILLLAALFSFSSLKLVGASQALPPEEDYAVPASPASVCDLSEILQDKSRASQKRKANSSASSEKRSVHTLESTPKRIVFPTLEMRFQPLAKEAQDYLQTHSKILPIQSDFSAFFRDYKITTSSGKAVLSRFPQEFCPHYSDRRLAKLIQDKHRHKRSPLEKINGKAPKPLYGHIYNASIFAKEVAKTFMSYRALQAKKTELFYDGGNTLWAENQYHQLKFLVGEALVQLNQILLEKAGEPFSKESVLEKMSRDLDIPPSDIIVLSQDALDYHIDFALIPAPGGALMLKDPKAGTGALLYNKTVYIQAPNKKRAEGKILSYNPDHKNYVIRVKDQRKLIYEDLRLPREFFLVKDPHKEKREQVKELLEHHGFKVIPTPMVFPKEEHCVYLTNPIYWKSKETGTYHFMLMGVQDKALREEWASFVRREAFPGKDVEIYFLGENSSFEKAEKYTIENQAGLHCITFEDNSPTLLLKIRKQ